MDEAVLLASLRSLETAVSTCAQAASTTNQLLYLLHQTHGQAAVRELLSDEKYADPKRLERMAESIDRRAPRFAAYRHRRRLGLP